MGSQDHSLLLLQEKAFVFNGGFQWWKDSFTGIWHHQLDLWTNAIGERERKEESWNERKMVISKSDEVFLLPVLRNSSNFICPSSPSRHNTSARLPATLSYRENLFSALYGNDFWQLLISGWFTRRMNKRWHKKRKNDLDLTLIMDMCY